MITLIHGEDIATSRKYFLENKKSPDMPTFFGSTVTLVDLMQTFDGGDLFATKKVLFLEDFLSQKKTGKEYAAIISYIQKNAQTHDIFMWEGKELTKKTLNTFPIATIKAYKFPQSLFLFLDNVSPHNSTQLLKLFYETQKQTEIGAIFYLLIRHVRILLALKDSGEPIEEVKRIAPWQKTKLSKQAQLFSVKSLSTMLQKLYAIDMAQKTGKLHVSLTQSLDFFLLDI